MKSVGIIKSGKYMDLIWFCQVIEVICVVLRGNRPFTKVDRIRTILQGYFSPQIYEIERMNEYGY